MTWIKRKDGKTGVLKLEADPRATWEFRSSEILDGTKPAMVEVLFRTRSFRKFSLWDRWWKHSLIRWRTLCRTFQLGKVRHNRRQPEKVCQVQLWKSCFESTLQQNQLLRFASHFTFLGFEVHSCFGRNRDIFNVLFGGLNNAPVVKGADTGPKALAFGEVERLMVIVIGLESS